MDLKTPLVLTAKPPVSVPPLSGFPQYVVTHMATCINDLAPLTAIKDTGVSMFYLPVLKSAWLFSHQWTQVT